MTASRKDVNLYDLVNPEDPKAVSQEVRYLLSLMGPGACISFLDQAFSDVRRIYQGSYQGLRASNTRYHDLTHALAVYLALARLCHGAMLSGEKLGPRPIILCLAAALFHDIGFIQAEGDDQGTGAKHMIGHEERSMAFARDYLLDKGFSPRDADDCAAMIQCTELDVSVDDAAFSSAETALAGRLLAAGDLLAQVADRMYLEKLLLLYREFQEAGIGGYDTELMLLEKTENFYEHQVKRRIQKECRGVDRFLRPHFQERWNMDRDLYADAVRKNLDYLSDVLKDYRDNYRNRLRRGGIVMQLGREGN